MAFAHKPIGNLVHNPVHKDINQVLYESVGSNNHKEVEDIIKDVHIMEILKEISNVSLEEVGFYYPYKRKSHNYTSKRFKLPYFIMNKIRKDTNSKYWRRLNQLLDGERYFSEDDPKKVTMMSTKMTRKDLVYLINGSVGLY